MSILPKLASSLGRNDEVPNQKLAEQIVKTKNRTAVTKLGTLLQHADKNIQSDAIKVLYEIGEREPELISELVSKLIEILDYKNQRLVWGAMTALDSIASEKSKEIFTALPTILRVAEGESVIARDHAVGILIKLSSQPKFAKKTLPLLFTQLKKAPANQLPMYAEQSAPAIPEKDQALYKKILLDRLKSLPKESQRKRVEKVIRKLK